MKTRTCYIQFIPILVSFFIIFFILPYIYSQELAPQVIYESTSQAVMMIKVYDTDSSLYATGTAVAVGDSGIIYTNMHIFKDSKWMELLRRSDTIRDLKIVGFDPDKDILVLKIPIGKIHGIHSANSDSVKIGEPVYALGNPQGYLNTFSNGILSGVRNSGDKQLQYTASISPGSSGGALLNSKGELIGITSSYYKNGQNLNFAVPVNFYSNTALINSDDSIQVRLLKDIVEIYNSKSDLKNDDILLRLSQYSMSSLKNRNALYTTAKIYLDNGFSDSSLNICNMSILQFPCDKQFYALRGTVYDFQGITDSALYDYDKSLAIDSVYESALFSRAFLNINKLKNPKGALKDYLRLIDINSGNEFLYVDVAEIYLQQNDTVNALASLKKSYWFEGYLSDYLYYRGKIFSDLKKYDEAAWDFSSAITLNPENEYYYYSRAVAYSKLARHDKAMVDYFKVLSFNPRDASAISNLAYEYFNLGDYMEAEKQFRKSIEINSKNVDTYIGLSITANKLNKINECKQSMYKAFKLSHVLESGLSGLDSLKKDGYFWSDYEIKNIKEVFVIMGVEDTNNDMFADNDDDNSASKSVQKPVNHKMAKSIK